MRFHPKFKNEDVREAAAMICAIAASTPKEWYATIERGLDLDFESEGLDSLGYVAHDLAVAAYNASQRYNGELLKVGDPTMDAEAEAKIRSGWIPETSSGC